MEIIKLSTKLQLKSEEIPLEDGKKLAKQLFEILAANPTGYFLTANQIGTPKRVGIVNVRKPLLFINPKIIKQDVDIDTVESSLSFPNQIFQTRRSKIIAVDADNYEKTIIFGSDLPETKLTDTVVMEAVFVQAMIDAMDGILPTERFPMVGSLQIKIEKKGRTKVIKARKFNRFKNLGWKIKN